MNLILFAEPYSHEAYMPTDKTKMIGNFKTKSMEKQQLQCAFLNSIHKLYIVYKDFFFSRSLMMIILQFFFSRKSANK